MLRLMHVRFSGKCGAREKGEDVETTMPLPDTSSNIIKGDSS